MGEGVSDIEPQGNYLASTGGRRSGKNLAMQRTLGRLKPGLHVILGPGGYRREIDVQGDAVVVEDEGQAPVSPAPG